MNQFLANVAAGEEYVESGVYSSHRIIEQSKKDVTFLHGKTTQFARLLIIIIKA